MSEQLDEATATPRVSDEQSEQQGADLLVEEVSIDGMCGVY